MSAPHESEDDDHRLSRYLLGLLPDEEAERLDEASIADDAVAARLRAVEHDLVDAYVRRRLPEPTRRQFEAFYLASPRRRQQVTMAEAFLASVDRRAGAAPGAVAVAVAEPVPGPPAPSWRGLAMAAMLTLVIGGGLLLTVGRGGREPDMARDEAAAMERVVSSARAPRAADSPADAAQPDPAADTADQGRGRGVLAQAPSGRPPDVAPGPAGSASPQSPRLIFVVPPPTRGAGPLPEIAVPPLTDAVTLDLQLDANDFARYQAVLKDPEADAVVWRSRRMAARSAASHPTAAVVVPAAVLRAKVYSLELSGYGPSGAGQLVGVYAFRIVRR